MSESKLRELAMDFSVQIIALVKELKAKYEGVLWYAAKLRTIQEPIEVFDEELWHTLLDRVTVTADTLVFIFKDGTEIEIEI